MKSFFLDVNSDSIIYLIIYAVALIVVILITRAIFSIGTIVRNLKAQTSLLAFIAESNGIDEKILKDILLKVAE